MTIRCFRCDKLLSADQKVVITGKNITVCRDCAESEYNQCELCGNYVCFHDYVHINDKRVCLWCASEKYFICSHCRDFLDRRDVVKFHGIGMCRDCKREYFKKCDICGQEHEEDEFDYIYFKEQDQYKDVCLTCRKAKFFCCDSCGGFFPNAQRRTLNNENYCPDCLNYIVSDAEADALEKENIIRQAALHAKFYNHDILLKMGSDTLFIDRDNHIVK
jgi:formylmethanofuran dehydrogenase subunit E